MNDLNIKEIAANARKSLLPRKSKLIYEDTYSAYRKWCQIQKITRTTEDSILAYFSSELMRYKSSSLWSKYSMLRTTININEGVDISKFPNITAYLKRQADGYKPKKSLVLLKEHVDAFLIQADNKVHLLNKVRIH